MPSESGLRPPSVAVYARGQEGLRGLSSPRHSFRVSAAAESAGRDGEHLLGERALCTARGPI